MFLITVSHGEWTMNKTSDNTIRALIEKKKELLDNLLLLSIHQLIEGNDLESLIKKRQRILTQLQRNDQALDTREQQIGIDSRTQEKQLFGHIRRMLKTITENNSQAILRTERALEKLENEKNLLGKETRVSMYVSQPEGYQRRHGSFNKHRMGKRYPIGTTL